MPHPVNLLQLAYDIPHAAGPRASACFPTFERQLSHRARPLKANADELASLKALVEACRAAGASIGDCEGYVFSFTIPHISKEFDLLKIAERAVLDIELKSASVSRERILRQLRQNRYYLGHLKRPTRLFTYVAEGAALYELVNDELVGRTLPSLVQAMHDAGASVGGDYAALFNPADYLVSPADDTDAFLRGSYFLTNQQEEFKRAILHALGEGGRGDFVVRGAAGTGKTLFLYDLSKELVARTGRDACVVHCGPSLALPGCLPLARGSLLTVLPSELGGIDLSALSVLALDEAHRLDDVRLRHALAAAERAGVPLVAGVDASRLLYEAEHWRSVNALLSQVVPAERQFLLTAKIRTNENLVAFIRDFFDRRHARLVPSGSVELVYAEGPAEAGDLLQVYKQRGYQAIYLGVPAAASLPKDGAFAVRDVVGREFESVVVALPDCFAYESRRLCVRLPQGQDAQANQQLYEAMTRAREKLALVFVGNKAFFEEVLGMLGSDA